MVLLMGVYSGGEESMEKSDFTLSSALDSRAAQCGGEADVGTGIPVCSARAGSCRAIGVSLRVQPVHQTCACEARAAPFERLMVEADMEVIVARWTVMGEFTACTYAQKSG